MIGEPFPLAVQAGIKGIVGEQPRLGVDSADTSKQDIVRQVDGTARRAEGLQRF